MQSLLALLALHANDAMPPSNRKSSSGSSSSSSSSSTSPKKKRSRWQKTLDALTPEERQALRKKEADRKARERAAKAKAKAEAKAVAKAAATPGPLDISQLRARADRELRKRLSDLHVPAGVQVVVLEKYRRNPSAVLGLVESFEQRHASLHAPAAWLLKGLEDPEKKTPRWRKGPSPPRGEWDGW
jgi:hypothetical protein